MRVKRDSSERRTLADAPRRPRERGASVGGRELAAHPSFIPLEDRGGNPSPVGLAARVYAGKCPGAPTRTRMKNAARAAVIGNSSHVLVREPGSAPVCGGSFVASIAPESSCDRTTYDELDTYSEALTQFEIALD